MLRQIISKKKTQEKEFMRHVQEHERAWGIETYKGRPSLDQLMEAKVVAFWYPVAHTMHPTATIHRSIDEINVYITHLVLHTKERLPPRRLETIFVEKSQIKIKGVKVIYQQTD